MIVGCLGSIAMVPTAGLPVCDCEGPVTPEKIQVEDDEVLVGPSAAMSGESLGPRLCEVWGPLGLSGCSSSSTHLSVTRLLG
jgi:hypothetical protein